MSDKLRELELREVRMPEPAPETVERVWRGIQGQIASGGPALELKTGPLFTELPARVVSLKLILGGALVLLGVVGVGVVGSRWRTEAPAESEREVASEPEVATETPPEAPPSQPVTPIAPIVPNEVQPTAEAPPPSVVVAPKAQSKPKPEPAPKPRTLADEVALIQAISTSLKQGAWKSVLKLVAEHERDFPNGQFVEERQAAKVRAQCRSGALDVGRKAAERFTTSWPTSIHRATIREDCGL
jgi:outer membrane biosynthesis protein TonB